MESSTGSSPILSEDVARFFEEEGLMTVIINNKRKISTSTISPPSSLPSLRTSASSSTEREISPESFTASFVREEAEEIEIPADLRSLETYAFLGFDDATAASLWERYINTPADMPASFLDFAFWQIDENPTPDATSASDDWDLCLRSLGINDKLRTAILLPEFEDLRYTASCKYWVLDAIETTYETLETMNEKMRLEAARLRRAKSRPGHQAPSMASPKGRKPRTDPLPALVAASPPSSTIETFGDAPSHVGGPSHVSPATTTQKTNPGTPTSIMATSSAASSAIVKHTMIWRAGSRQKAENFYNQMTSQISLEAISTVPGDFSSTRRVAYWTTQKETADRYAQWCKHKMSASEIAFIQVAVPESFTDSLATEYLWCGDRQKPTDAWKKLIWHIRRGLMVPDELDYLDEKDLLIGHIASGIHKKIEHLKDHTQIGERDVLTVKIDGEERKAVQGVFNTKKAMRGFAETSVGKVWIHSAGHLMVPPEQHLS